MFNEEFNLETQDNDWGESLMPCNVQDLIPPPPKPRCCDGGTRCTRGRRAK
jgi:hypothetical protein